MEAYKEELLLNTVIIEKSEELFQGNFITKEQLSTINKGLPTLKGSKNLLVRILFFFLGVFLYSSICGAISLMLLPNLDNETLWKIVPFIYAVVGIVALEVIIIPQMKFFKNGVDDAFVLGIILSIAIGFGLSSDFKNWIISISVFAVASLCYFRYLNIPALLISVISFVVTISFIMIDYIIYGSAILPILLAVLAIVFYSFSSKLQNTITKPYYYQGVILIKYFSVVLFYLSFNYAVITELSAVLMPHLETTTFSTIMSYIFIVLTAIIPIFYIYKGIQNKDKPLFIIGLLSLAGSYSTLRYYNSFISIDLEMIIGGFLIFLISYFIIIKIKNNVQGVTFLPDRLSPNNSAQLEILASVAQFGHNATTVESNPMEFGGGGFSGGGAGESF